MHYYVWHDEIWQLLSDNERGWHAADGSTRRKDHRGGQTGGNLDTIAIECIGKDAETEETAAKLTAHLCKTYGLDPAYDVYTHNFWMYGADTKFSGVRKNCPEYILPHWDEFLTAAERYSENGVQNSPASSDSKLYRVQLGAFKDKKNAEKLANELKEKGLDTYVTFRE